MAAGRRAPENRSRRARQKSDYVAKTFSRSLLPLPPEKISPRRARIWWVLTCSTNWCAALCSTSCAMKGIFTRRPSGDIWYYGSRGCLNGAVFPSSDRQVAIANPMALPFVSGKLITRRVIRWSRRRREGTGTEAGIRPQYGWISASR